MSITTYQSIESMMDTVLQALALAWGEKLTALGYEVTQAQVEPTKSPTVFRASVVFHVPASTLTRDHYLAMGDFLRANGVTTEVQYKRGDMLGKHRLVKATWPVFFPR